MLVCSYKHKPRATTTHTQKKKLKSNPKPNPSNQSKRNKESNPNQAISKHTKPTLFLSLLSPVVSKTMSTAAGSSSSNNNNNNTTEPNQNQHQLFMHHQLYHVPQHSRREKLRFPPDSDSLVYLHTQNPNHFYPYPPPQTQTQLLPPNIMPSTNNFSLSLSSSSSNPPVARRQPLADAATGPYGPFTGYAAVLGRSRFLGPSQKLLEGICDVGMGGGRGRAVDRVGEEGLLDSDPVEMDGGDRGGVEGMDDEEWSSSVVSGAEQQWRKTRLISMMEDVCKRYRQYYQQIQAVVSSFETVAGLSNASPYASMALKAMAKHFKCLKSMITTQLRNTSRIAGKDGLSKEEIANFGMIGNGAFLQRVNNAAAFGQPNNIWRPQRGLPERAVTVLRAWLFEHFLHPYPTDSDKQMLAKQTGLTRNQVSNWFINARVRLWKPMVEEIHNLEIRQLQKHPVLDTGHRDIQQPQNSSDCSENPSDSQPGQSSRSVTRNHSIPTARSIRDELPQMHNNNNNIQGAITFAYDGLSPHRGIASSHPQVGVVAAAGSGNGGVSLTLGLPQNNRVTLAEPLPASLPANLVHRFGLEDINEAYVLGSFGAQDRHFAKEIGGHLLHDFVG